MQQVMESKPVRFLFLRINGDRLYILNSNNIMDCEITFDYQSFQFELQRLLPGFKQHYTLLLPVSLSQKLLATLTLPLQLPLSL